jgi:hypothetical protein
MRRDRPEDAIDHASRRPVLLPAPRGRAMSAIVAAAQRLEDRRIDAVLGRAFVTGDRLRTMQVAAGDVLVDASNAAGAGRGVAMRLADCGCVEVTRGDGTTRTDPFMPWKCDPRPCAWPRPFARGATP